jgi:hypothetical protein
MTTQAAAADARQAADSSAPEKAKPAPAKARAPSTEERLTKAEDNIQNLLKSNTEKGQEVRRLTQENTRLASEKEAMELHPDDPERQQKYLVDQQVQARTREIESDANQRVLRIQTDSWQKSNPEIPASVFMDITNEEQMNARVYQWLFENGAGKPAVAVSEETDEEPPVEPLASSGSSSLGGPSGSGVQELVNMFGRGEQMSADDMKTASDALDKGTYPKVTT